MPWHDVQWEATDCQTAAVQKGTEVGNKSALSAYSSALQPQTVVLARYDFRAFLNQLK